MISTVCELYSLKYLSHANATLLPNLAGYAGDDSRTDPKNIKKCIYTFSKNELIKY